MDETPGMRLPLIDNLHAPDVFATGATGFINLGGAIAITFETVRADHRSNPGPVNRVVIGRLVLPNRGAQALAAGLLDFLKQHNLAPNPPTPDEVQ
jgi:hypothetical protein